MYWTPRTTLICVLFTSLTGTKFKNKDWGGAWINQKKNLHSGKEEDMWPQDCKRRRWVGHESRTKAKMCFQRTKGKIKFQWMTGMALDTWFWKTWTFSWLTIFACWLSLLLAIKTMSKIYASSRIEGRHAEVFSVTKTKQANNKTMSCLIEQRFFCFLKSHCWVHRQ